MTDIDPAEMAEAVAAERTLADFLSDLSDNDALPEDIREEASEWYDAQVGHAPDPDESPEEGQEPG